MCSSCWERCWLRTAGSGGLEHTGLHQREGGGNKRDEEGALKSIELQKEAAVRRGSYEHGVSDVDVSLHVLAAVSILLAWLRTWPCRGLWQDPCRAWKRSGSQRCSLVLHGSRVRVWPRRLLQAASDGQPWGCGVGPLPSWGGTPRDRA